MSVDRIADEVLAAIRDRGTYRRLRVLEGAQAPRMQVDGRDVLLFAGSNYLDLAHHDGVVEASVRASREYGCAAAGSRLINGTTILHQALESELADFFGREAALTFNTGYMANVGVIPALVGEGDLLVSDALNHASIIDGGRLARAEVRVFAHGDLDALEALLAQSGAPDRRVLLVVDGLFSMDGDLAPVAEMAALAHRHGAIMMLDDAHGTGTLGARGRGSAEHLGALAEVDILMGTLGKSLGSFGAFVAGSAKLRDLLINTARSFIFSCALAPPQAAAARAALALVDAEPWRRFALQQRAARLRERLAQHGLSTSPSCSHIVPVVIGDNATTMEICEALLERGFYAQGIRHPSVPIGSARLRITPMATHAESEIDALADAIAEQTAKYAPETIVARREGGAGTGRP
ncbi:MAG: 8-amino-7-oxononanoate synthase [Deltaproteobacteria bacterium]|nr:8-amino-7-oxononanoate synthase [Deltaproteobacteria bacterium]MBW2385120.1 8-amino-7-oxononanoate synthase [Deltaproteobacteria bacterium]